MELCGSEEQDVSGFGYTDNAQLVGFIVSFGLLMGFVDIKENIENQNQVYCQVGVTYEEFASVLWCVTINIVSRKYTKDRKQVGIGNKIQENIIKYM